MKNNIVSFPCVACPGFHAVTHDFVCLFMLHLMDLQQAETMCVMFSGPKLVLDLMGKRPMKPDVFIIIFKKYTRRLRIYNCQLRQDNSYSQTTFVFSHYFIGWQRLPGSKWNLPVVRVFRDYMRSLTSILSETLIRLIL